MRKKEPFLFFTIHIKCAPLDKAYTHTQTQIYFQQNTIQNAWTFHLIHSLLEAFFFEYSMHLNWSDPTPAQHSQIHTRCSSNSDNDKENKNWRRRRQNEILQKWVSEYFAAVLVSPHDPPTLRAPTNESALISHIVYVALILMVRLQCVSSTSGYSVPESSCVSNMHQGKKIVEITTRQK